MMPYLILIGVFFFISIVLFKRSNTINEYVGFGALIVLMVVDIVSTYPAYPSVYPFLILACVMMMAYKFYQDRKAVATAETE